MKSAAVRFIEAAQPYVNWVESAGGSGVGFRALHRALSQLQIAAVELPTVSGADFDDAADAFKTRLKHDPRVQLALAARLPVSAYSLVFDPLDEADRVAILTTLDDDLAGVYWDIADGIALAKAGYYGDAVWHWRLAYFDHWGRHVVHAQSAIWQYLRNNQGSN